MKVKEPYDKGMSLANADDWNNAGAAENYKLHLVVPIASSHMSAMVVDSWDALRIPLWRVARGRKYAAPLRSHEDQDDDVAVLSERPNRRYQRLNHHPR